MPFIVLEGLDGAGKSTQVRLIENWLTGKGIQFEYLHFPRFDAPIYGDLIARFLRGELGALNEVNPYIVALLYAGDRADAAAMIRCWLTEGKVVIVDRYVYSNVGFQCAKIEDREERKSLRDWIVDLEYEQNKIPSPDVSLFLDVPFSFTKRSLENARQGEDRDYLNGKQDIHEASLSLQERVRQVYLEQVCSDNKFKVIECSSSDGEMLTADNIFTRIKTLLEEVLKMR